jgi:pSer/pThr/pTyr-binding forkhead associated (FHA) protein
VSLGVLVFVFAILALLIFRVFLSHGWRSSLEGLWGLGRRPEPIEPEPPQYYFPAPQPEMPRRPTRLGGSHFLVPEPGQPTAILVGISSPVEGQRFSVEKEIFHIGANQENDLSIEHDKYVSRNHAYLLYERGHLFIFDKRSRNGTFINEKAVTDTGAALSLGDRIRVGNSTFKLISTQISEVNRPYQERKEEKKRPPPIPDFRDERIQVIRLITAISISAVVLIAALFVILHDSEPDESKKWAFGAVGTIVGYWLKA